jgi:hypothetical protein
LHVPYEVVYGQHPKVGINAARSSHELRNKIWKEDELLKELGMVGEGQFLDTDPEDMANITRPHATPDEDL